MVVYVFQGIGSFNLTVKFTDTELFVAFLHYPLDVCRTLIMSPLSLLIIGNLCLLLFVNAARALSILLIFCFKKKLFLTFILLFLFSISLTSALAFIIFFRLLVLGLICSSFPSILRFELR